MYPTNDTGVISKEKPGSTDKKSEKISTKGSKPGSAQLGHDRVRQFDLGSVRAGKGFPRVKRYAQLEEREGEKFSGEQHAREAQLEEEQIH